MMTRLAATVLAVFLLQATHGASAQSAGAGYRQLVERAKAGDPALDYTALRMAYAASPGYQPYGHPPGRDEMIAAANAGDYASALADAEKVLTAKFVDIDAHAVSAMADRALNRPEAAAREQALTRGLLRSIASSGDGRTPTTAYVVISVDEEYALLRALDLKPGEQALINAQGHSYDKLDAVSRQTGQTQTLYFNIDRPMGQLDQELRPPAAKTRP
jgi:hypothetical protein